MSPKREQAVGVDKTTATALPTQCQEVGETTHPSSDVSASREEKAIEKPATGPSSPAVVEVSVSGFPWHHMTRIVGSLCFLCTYFLLLL